MQYQVQQTQSDTVPNPVPIDVIPTNDTQVDTLDILPVGGSRSDTTIHK